MFGRLPALLGAFALTLVAAAPARANPTTFKDQLVQAPSIGLPQRGSIACSLSKLDVGAAELARGAYALPLSIEVPAQRGPLLAKIFPSYSIEAGISEWGMGWSTDLSIRRHRLVGEVAFDEHDGFTSPW